MTSNDDKRVDKIDEIYHHLKDAVIHLSESVNYLVASVENLEREVASLQKTTVGKPESKTTETKVMMFAPKLPTKGSKGAAGYDLYANEEAVVPANSRLLVGTGVYFSCPDNFYCQIKPRSGLALKGISVDGGVIDSDYRGEFKVIMVNNTNNIFVVNKGDRIGQLLFLPLANIKIEEVKSKEELDKTNRDGGGFGSTGK